MAEPEDLRLGQTWRGNSPPDRTIIAFVGRCGATRDVLVRYRVTYKTTGPAEHLVTEQSFAAWARELVAPGPATERGGA